GCEGLVRLVVCCQDRTELLTRHRTRSLLESHKSPDCRTAFDRVQMHWQQLIGDLGGGHHANFHIVITEASIQSRIFTLLEQHAHRPAYELPVKGCLLAPAELTQDAAALLDHWWRHRVDRKSTRLNSSHV